MSLILSIWTVVAFVMFIAITVWAWNSANKKNFDAAARIPFDEDEPQTKQEGSNHG